MKLRYTVTEQAYLDFNIYHAEHSDTLRKTVRWARLGLSLSVLLIGLGASIWLTYRFGFRPVTLGYFAGCLAVSALLYALYPGRYRKSLEKRLKSYIAEGNGKEFLGEFTLEALDDRLRMEGVEEATEVTYGKVGKMVENKGCLYIYTGGMSAFILPLEAFGGEEAYRGFRGLLAEKIQAAKTAA